MIEGSSVTSFPSRSSIHLSFCMMLNVQNEGQSSKSICMKDNIVTKEEEIRKSTSSEK